MGYGKQKLTEENISRYPINGGNGNIGTAGTYKIPVLKEYIDIAKTNGTDMEPRLFNRIRCLGEQALGLLGLREGHDLPDGLAAAEERREPVHPQGNPPMGRSAVGQSLEEEAETPLRLLRRYAEALKGPGLHLRIVDSDGKGRNRL